MKKYIIIAPHADDEIIGGYGFLSSGKVDTVAFCNKEALIEAIPSSQHFGFKIELFTPEVLEKHKDKIFLFPDPTYELHPEHRSAGNIGEAFLRTGKAVIFYVTNMLSPYIHEVPQAAIKRHCLNTLYPGKASLWECDYKYFLFEGYTQWIIKS